MSEAVDQDRARELLEDSDSTVAQARDHVLESRSEVVAAVLEDAGVNRDVVERSVVVIMRSAGHTWQEVADALGMSRQAAHERFRDTGDM